MIRRAWLILALAALFGLRAPLCVFACSVATPAAAAAASAHHDESAAPCHGEAPMAPADAPSPETPVGQHECDCDSVRAVLAKAESPAAAHALDAPAPVVLRTAWAARATAFSVAGYWDRRHDLPPPDLLLLTRSLLL